MGWIIETVLGTLWVAFISAMGEGRPWWVKVLWVISPIFIFAGLIVAAWLFVIGLGGFG